MDLKEYKKAKLPDSPGVYLFKKGRDILYIGKATSLKDRVKSYFSDDLIKTRGPRMVDAILKAQKIDFIKTDSVLEALVLEADLIKKYKPVYNIKEKDDRSYNYLIISKDEIPLVQIKRKREIDFELEDKNYKYIFGPFPSQNQLREALKIIRKIFPFSDGKNYSKLYQQIGLEPDLSQKEVLKSYLKNIRNIALFFKGKKNQIIKNLEKDMKDLSKKREFEKAAKIRNQIFALNHLKDVSLIGKDEKDIESKFEKDFRIESFDVAHMSGKNSVGVMTVVQNGEVLKPEYKKFILRDTKRGDDVGGIKEILTRRLKHTEWNYPSLIVIDGGKNQLNAAEKVLNELNIKIPLVSVVKDERHKPKDILGDKKTIEKYLKESKSAILLANSESHRFAINFFRKKQSSSFLGKRLK